MPTYALSLLLVLIATSPEAATPPTADDSTSKPASKPSSRPDSKPDSQPKVSERARLPYPVGRWIEYVYLNKGEEWGRAYIRFEAVSGPKPQCLVTRVVDFTAPGRRFLLEDEVLLDANWEPVKTIERVRVTRGEYESLTQVLGAFEKDASLIDFHVDSSLHEQRESARPSPCHHYPKHSFFAAIAPILAHNHPKGAQLPMFSPFDAKAYVVEFKPVRVEKHDGKVRHRWTSSHPTFEAVFWLSENGALEKYQQGDLEVIRVEHPAKPPRRLLPVEEKESARKGATGEKKE